MLHDICIGKSEWYYDHQEHLLYTPGTSTSESFLIYLQKFNAVEINATFSGSRLPMWLVAGIKNRLLNLNLM